jgi:hypothetical protein
VLGGEPAAEGLLQKGELAALAGRLRSAATLEVAIGRPQVIGGTAPERVQEALQAARARLDEEGPALPGS